MLPVLAALAARQGVIVVLNLDGSTSVYGPQGLFDTLDLMIGWLDEAIDFHGPGGLGPDDDPDHGREAISMAAAAAVLRKAE